MINYKEIFTVVKITLFFYTLVICNSSNACIDGEEKSLGNGYSTGLTGSYFNGDLLVTHGSSGRPTIYFEIKDSNNKILKDSISFPKFVGFGYKETKEIETFDCKYNIDFFGGWTMNMIIKRKPRTNISKKTKNVSIRMSGFRNTKQPRDPERVYVPNGVSKTIGLESGTTEEVQFALTEGNT